MQRAFQTGEVIWAKIKGYPWWPAIVSTVATTRDGNSRDIRVNFIGENSHAVLPDEKVAKFDEKLNEFSHRKHKKLNESIEIALRILTGETNYEEERRKLDAKNRGLISAEKRKFSSSSSRSESTNRDRKIVKSGKESIMNGNSTIITGNVANKTIIPPTINPPPPRRLFRQKSLLRSRRGTSKKHEKSGFFTSERIQMQKALKESLKEKGKREHSREKPRKQRHFIEPEEEENILKFEETDTRTLGELASEFYANLAFLTTNLQADFELLTPSLTRLSQDLNPLETKLSAIDHNDLIANCRILKMMTFLESQLSRAPPTISSVQKVVELSNSTRNLIEKLKGRLITHIFDPSDIQKELCSEPTLSSQTSHESGKNSSKDQKLMEIETSKRPEKAAENTNKMQEEDEDALEDLTRRRKSRIRKIIDFDDELEFIDETPKLPANKLDESPKVEASKSSQNNNNKNQPKKKQQPSFLSPAPQIVEELTTKSHKDSGAIVEETPLLPVQSSGAGLMSSLISRDKKDAIAILNKELGGQTAVSTTVNITAFSSSPERSNSIHDVIPAVEKPDKLTMNSITVTSTLDQQTHENTNLGGQEGGNCGAGQNSLSLTAQLPCNKTLRKKICQKMAKTIHEKYAIEKEAAQSVAIRVEGVIRESDPDMQEEYKSRVYILMKVLKLTLISREKLVDPNTRHISAILTSEEVRSELVRRGELHADENNKELLSNNAIAKLRRNQHCDNGSDTKSEEAKQHSEELSDS